MMIHGMIGKMKPKKRNKGHFVKGGVQVSNMEGVPDVAYDEVKESHYRDNGLIFFTVK